MTKLDIISDPICPWCYIGKARLEAALAERPDHPFTIEWHPFQLNPDMPPEGLDQREYLELKFGGREGAVKVYSQIAEAAEQAGVKVAFDKIERTPNTIDAHRLIHWAGLEGLQDAVVDLLFLAYFQDGVDISDKSALTAIGAKAGMDPAMLATLFDGENDVDGIRARDAYARERGVTGVPCFIINNQYVVQGAQGSDLWQRVIDELTAEKPQQDAP